MGAAPPRPRSQHLPSGFPDCVRLPCGASGSAVFWTLTASNFTVLAVLLVPVVVAIDQVVGVVLVWSWEAKVAPQGGWLH